MNFGFNSSPGHTTASPANYMLNGTSLNGGDTPAVSINNVIGSEGNSGVTPFKFTVSLSSASTQAITVDYATANGTAQAGSDYQAAAGTLTFAPGETSKSVTVSVLGDTTVENDETFTLTLSNPVNATLSIALGTGTIKNDDASSPSSDNVQFENTSDWGTGFTGQITVTNTSGIAWTSWTLEFDFANKISSIWNAEISSHTGNHYVIENASYNGNLAAGSTLSFGFSGNPGNVTAGPTNYLLHGGGPVRSRPQRRGGLGLDSALTAGDDLGARQRFRSRR